ARELRAGPPALAGELLRGDAAAARQQHAGEEEAVRGALRREQRVVVADSRARRAGLRQPQAEQTLAEGHRCVAAAQLLEEPEVAIARGLEDQVDGDDGSRRRERRLG